VGVDDDTPAGLFAFEKEDPINEEPKEEKDSNLGRTAADDHGQTRPNLEDITPSMIEKYQSVRLNGVLTFSSRVPEPKTVNIEVKTLQRVLNVAVDLGLLAENPLKNKLSLLKEPEGRKR
jgi:hypothetical protein